MGFRRLVGFFVVVVANTKLFKPGGLNLTDAFTGEIQQFANLFERDATSICDIQAARFRQLPDFEVRKIELNRACMRIDVQIQMIFA